MWKSPKETGVRGLMAILRSNMPWLVLGIDACEAAASAVELVPGMLA